MAKDISKCYGLLKGNKKETEIIEPQATEARKRKWRSADFQYPKPQRGKQAL